MTDKINDLEFAIQRYNEQEPRIITHLGERRPALPGTAVRQECVASSDDVGLRETQPTLSGEPSVAAVADAAKN